MFRRRITKVPIQAYSFGPFASIWIGDTYSVLPNLPSELGTYSTEPLTQILCDTTKGQFLKASYVSKWSPSKKKNKRSSDFLIEFSLIFMGSDEQVKRIALGNSLTTTDGDELSSDANYFTIFCQDFDPNSKDSWLIPICQPEVNTAYNREKTEITNTPVAFKRQAKNPFSDPRIFYRRSIAELQAITDFGSRIPV